MRYPGVRVRELREDHDLTQIQVAQILHIAQSTYSMYENGAIELTAKTLCLLADFYGVSVDYLIGRTDERKPYPPSRRPEL